MEIKSKQNVRSGPRKGSQKTCAKFPGLGPFLSKDFLSKFPVFFRAIFCFFHIFIFFSNYWNAEGSK